MLSEFEIKNLQTVNGMLDGFRASLAEAEKELKGIDEKYKAIIAKEKETYKQTIVSCKKELDFWEKPIVKRYGKTIAELLANPNESVESEEQQDELPFAEDEKVVDTEAENEVPEFDGAGFTEEDNTIPVEENANWEETTEADAQEDKEDDNGGWGDFPEDWK